MLAPGIIAAASIGGTPPPPYHASAVHLAQDVFLSIASLTATDSGYYAFAFWTKWSSADATDTGVTFVHDPDSNYGPFGSYLEEDPPPPDAQFAFEFYPPDFSSDFAIYTEGGPITPGTWHFVIGAAYTNAGAGSRLAKVYIDGVDVTEISTDEGPAFINIVNGLKFLFGSDGTMGDTQVADFADVRFAPGQDWLTDGDIPPATQALFRNPDTGKPVDPAVATAALGAPAILFSGDALTFGTNQGTGGVAATTGVLANASTSPSD